jgi:hypothetical protein
MRQLNLQALFAFLSVFSLLFVPIGLVWFAIDLWHYSQAPIAAHAKLDYRGLDMTLGALMWFTVFLALFFIREPRFWKKMRKKK